MDCWWNQARLGYVAEASWDTSQRAGGGRGGAKERHGVGSHEIWIRDLTCPFRWLSAAELQVAVGPLVILFDQQRLAIAYKQAGHLGHPVRGIEGASFHQEPARRLAMALTSFLLAYP